MHIVVYWLDYIIRFHTTWHKNQT